MSAGDICGAIRFNDHQAERPCIRNRHTDDHHCDWTGREWSTPACAHEVRRSPLPYTSRPMGGHGIRVMRTGRTVLVAGQSYSPVDALELSAAIARAATETTTEGGSR